jgi:sulfonate transport system substrate-binding protein
MRLLVFLLVLLIGAGAAAEPLKIRIAWNTVPAQLTPLLFEDKDLLDHYGASYVVEHYHVSGNAPMVTLLAAGTVDIAPLAPSSLGVAIQNAGLEDVRVISDLYQDGVGRAYSSEYLVRAASDIAAVEDLKGKVLAVNVIDGDTDIALRLMLRRHGLGDPALTKVVETPYPNMAAMLEGGQVDLVGLIAPFSYALKERGTARALFRMKDVLGPTEALFNVARAGFLERNRAPLQDFFEDYARALRWYLAPRNREAAIQRVAQFTHQPEAAWAPYLFTEDDYYRDPGLRPDLAALQKNLDTLREVGSLGIAIDIAKYSDLSFIEAASRRLKRAP